jgi:hypothetical protein
MRGKKVKRLRRAFIARFGLPKNEREVVIWRRAWRMFKKEATRG